MKRAAKSKKSNHHAARKAHHKAKGKSVRRMAGFKGFDNTADIDLILSKKVQFQDLLGFTNERMSHLFESAVSLLQQRRYDEAIKAAEMLTQLNPYVSDFWICLGMAEQANGASQRALQAYRTAETMDPSRAEPYVNAIDCCLELNDPLQAEVIYNEALHYAKKHPHQSDSQMIMRELSYREDLIQYEKVRLRPFLGTPGK